MEFWLSLTTTIVKIGSSQYILQHDNHYIFYEWEWIHEIPGYGPLIYSHYETLDPTNHASIATLSESSSSSNGADLDYSKCLYNGEKYNDDTENSCSYFHSLWKTSHRVDSEAMNGLQIQGLWVSNTWHS